MSDKNQTKIASREAHSPEKGRKEESLREIPHVANMTHNALQHVSLWQWGSCFPLVGFPSIHKIVHCDHDNGKGRNHEQPGLRSKSHQCSPTRAMGPTQPCAH